MRKRRAFLGLIALFLPFILILNTNIYNVERSSQNLLVISDDLIYHVQNYVVALDIDELDIQAQINITYNVLSGIKQDGFKRFIIPKHSNGEILTIKVYDDEGLNLAWNYREFEGRDGNHYKEISFQHPGFTGIKTVSINFKMKNWIVERQSGTQIQLGNIGTFSISVKRAEYIIIFPVNYELEEIKSSASGIELFDELNNRLRYYFIQYEPISNDLSFTCSPHITNNPPLEEVNLIDSRIILVTVALVIVFSFMFFIIYAVIKSDREWSGGVGCGGCGGGGGCGGCGGGGGCGGCGG
ncbi:MAG: hypothetical protein ACFE94_00555 [Candidatus Hodarchaeota archaeon]